MVVKPINIAEGWNMASYSKFQFKSNYELKSVIAFWKWEIEIVAPRSLREMR